MSVRNLLFRAVVAAAKEVVAAAEGAKAPPPATPTPTPAPNPIPSEPPTSTGGLFRPLDLTPPPSTPSWSPPPPRPSPPPFPTPVITTEDAGVEGSGLGDDEMEDGDVEMRVEVARATSSGRNKPEHAFPAAAPAAAPSAPTPTPSTRSLSRALLLLMDSPDPNARPLPKRPVMRDGEDDEAYDARLETWSARVAALAPGHTTLRELADRPIDHAVMVGRIRALVNPKLHALIRGLDTKAALPILATDAAGADADVSLRVFPLFGKMGQLASGLGLDVGHELVSAMAELGWHVYGAEYSAHVFYVLFVPVSANAADITEALRVAEAQSVRHTAAPEWPLLGGVPVICVWNKMPL